MANSTPLCWVIKNVANALGFVFIWNTMKTGTYSLSDYYLHTRSVFRTFTVQCRSLEPPFMSSSKEPDSFAIFKAILCNRSQCFVFWTFAAFSFFFKSALVLDHFQRNAFFKICFVKPLPTSISSLEKGANQGMKLLGWNEALCRWGDSERAISQKRVFFKNWGNWTSEVQKKKWQAKNYPQHRNGP